MRRRDFIAGAVGLAAAGRTLQAQAQVGLMRRVAWLGLGKAGAPSPYVEALRAGLRELDWIEGRNLMLNLYWATGRDDMEEAARELLASNPEVIVAQEFLIYAFRPQQIVTPQVFGFSGDPVDAKLVQSLARPGGNATGMSYLALELVGKRIELLKEWVPSITRVAILLRPQHPGAPLERQATEEVIGKLGLAMSYFPYSSQWGIAAHKSEELEQAFAGMRRDSCDALVVFPDSSMFEISEQIARLALDARLPTVSGWAPFASSGLLMTYGPNVRELYRSLARYVDRILRGAKPGDLPVERPSIIELVINRKAARALQLDPPPPGASRSRRRGDRMRRRSSLYLLGGAVTLPSVARAQPSDQKAQHRCADAARRGQFERAKRVAVLVQELQKRGWSEGRSLQIEYRAAGDLREAAAELVEFNPDVLFATATRQSRLAAGNPHPADCVCDGCRSSHLWRGCQSGESRWLRNRQGISGRLER